MSKGIAAISDERYRQINQLGYSAYNDTGRAAELIRAAACYADHAANQLDYVSADEPHPFWPWSPESWNPGNSELRTMEKAGALIAAAYDALYQETFGEDDNNGSESAT